MNNTISMLSAVVPAFPGAPASTCGGFGSVAPIGGLAKGRTVSGDKALTVDLPVGYGHDLSGHGQAQADEQWLAPTAFARRGGSGPYPWWHTG